MTDPTAAARQAENALDGIEDALAKGVAPTLELQQAVGRASHAANELWHKIAQLRAEQWREDREIA